MFGFMFSMPSIEPGCGSQLAERIPKLKPKRPTKKQIAEVTSVSVGDLSNISTD